MATNLERLLRPQAAPERTGKATRSSYTAANRHNADGCLLARLMLWATRNCAN